LGLVLFLIMSAGSANAQATRTWVSGVGDDANPCSRTAPCKTFAGAISKTAAGGEINCLDPGGYGAVTITKSIMIACEMGTAGVLVSGTNGIIVNAGVNDVVFLKGLDFNGLGTGLSGIRFLAGKGLTVTDCVIRGFTVNGISFAPGTANASLVVRNTIVADNSGGGIQVIPSGGFLADALVTNSQMIRNSFGLRVDDNGAATVSNSTAASNTLNGFVAFSASAAAELNLADTVTVNNTNNGLRSQGANAIIRLVRVSSFDNATGISSGGGTVTSFSPATNANAGNGTSGAPNGAAIPLQ
jgi:hypothetical protein